MTGPVSPDNPFVSASQPKPLRRGIETTRIMTKEPRVELPPQARSRFERASFVRHLAIALAAVVAYVLREHVQTRNETLWIIGSIAIVNMLLTLVPDRPRWTRVSLFLSPIAGLAGWSALVYATGGASSMFVAGLWLEVLLSAWTCTSAGTRAVTAGAVAALWAPRALGVDETSIRTVVFQTAFLVAMGACTVLLTRHWRRAQRDADRDHTILMGRLRELESEIESLRALGEVGTHVALLAHGLKNAVHSLRGFAALMEPRHDDAEGRAEALDGLRAAIDRLEEIARVTLRNGDGLLSGTDTRRVIDETVAELSRLHPGIGWTVRAGERLPSIRADAAMLREALINLARNAVEAMDGSGEVSIETAVDDGRFEIRVRDHGPGFDAAELGRASPTRTTKPGGSGFGLFLTRRLVESRGGRLTARAPQGRGAVLCVALPLGQAECP